MGVGNDGYGLLCFFEDGILKYHYPYFDSCFVGVGTDPQINTDFSIKVVPNPVINTSLLTIEGDKITDCFQIEIYNLTGIKVFSGRFQKRFKIDRTDFQAGVYFFKVYNRNDFSYIGKFIVM